MIFMAMMIVLRRDEKSKNSNIHGDLLAEIGWNGNLGEEIM